VVNGRYFLGAVGMLNSLRMQGHQEPVHFLDCGLTPAQRELLARHANIVDQPREAPPYLSKTIAPLANPAEVAILIDTDMILTRPLTDLINEAGAGKVLAFGAGYERFFPQWGELLELGSVERRPYACSGLVMMGGKEGREVLGLMDAAQMRVPSFAEGPPDPRQFFENVVSYPFGLADQDVLNAVLCSRPADGRVEILDHGLAPEPPFAGIRVVDGERLGCAARDGTEPYLLHHLGAKPWLVPMGDGPYSRLLSRLLVGPGLEIRIPEADVPLRLRNGPSSAAARRLAGLQGRLRSVRDSLSWRLGSGAGQGPGRAESSG
jgi:hypothetical protein